jgi:uncharacterized protein (TIGR02145 family)
MNHFLKITTIVFLSIILITIVQSCRKKTVPIVMTVTISGITQTSAVSVGNVTDDGGTEVTAYGVCWDTSGNPTTKSNKTIDGEGTGVFVSNITGLSENTKYNVRVYATNSEGTSYGKQISFSTSPIFPATLTTTEISSILTKSAVTGGNINSDGGGSITARGVCWSTTSNPTISGNKTNDGNGIGNFISNITGLQYGTTYYVRSYATNSAGTGYGNEVSFTTIPIFLATLTTEEVSSILSTSAISGGVISSDGGGSITGKGISWNTTGAPRIKEDDYSDNGSGVEDFSSTMRNLKRGTQYFVRAFATNEAGTAYGNQLSFVTTLDEVSPIIFNPELTYGTVSDIEGNTYKTIQIVAQTWMAENLKTTRFNDGTPIPLVAGDADWANLKTPGYCWYFNDIYYKSFYGALYNWYTVNTRKLCPSGWHVPTDLDWTTLIDYLEWDGVAGGPLKEVGTSHWLYPNTGATNESGFTALPAGIRYDVIGVFSSLNSGASWWSSTDYSSVGACNLFIRSDETKVYRSTNFKSLGTSIRCIKD